MICSYNKNLDRIFETIVIDNFIIDRTTNETSWSTYAIANEMSDWIGNIEIKKGRGKLWGIIATTTTYDFGYKTVFYAHANLNNQNQKLKYLKRCCVAIDQARTKELWDGVRA